MSQQSRIIERGILVDALLDAHMELERAIDAWNEADVDIVDIDAYRFAVEDKLSALNAKIQEAVEWAKRVASTMQEFFDASDEVWQESDDGEACKSGVREYENFHPELVILELDDEMDVPDCTAIDDLKALPEPCYELDDEF
jgi:hypothetical protein